MIPPPVMTAARTRTHSAVVMGHFPMRFSIASMVSLPGRSVMVGILDRRCEQPALQMLQNVLR